MTKQMTRICLAVIIVIIAYTAVPTHATIGKYPPELSFHLGRTLPVAKLAKHADIGFNFSMAFDVFPKRRFSTGITGNYSLFPGKGLFSNPGNTSINGIRIHGKIYAGSDMLKAFVIEFGGGIFDRTKDDLSAAPGAVIGISQRVYGTKHTAFEIAAHFYAAKNISFFTLSIGIASL